MSQTEVLLGQIQALVDSLSNIRELVRMRKGQSRLLALVSARFETDIYGLLKRCMRLREAAPGGLEATWRQFGTLQRDAASLTQECLAFLGGILAREAGVDKGLCALADAMLYRLAERSDLPWPRFTIAGPSEFFGTQSGIVRLRFPDVQIWNLPVAAHEFGHYVGAQSKFGDLAGLMEQETRSKPEYAPHLRELFSDLFATFALGPAYALNCVLLRFSPSDGNLQSNTHPSFSERVWWMCDVLRKMQRAEGDPPMYDYVIGKIESLWAASLTGVNEAPALGETDVARLRRWSESLYDLVDTQIQSVRYRTWLRAQSVFRDLRDRTDPDLQDDDEVPDILNAAWLYYLEMETPDRSGAGKTAFDLCQTIAQRTDKTVK